MVEGYQLSQEMSHSIGEWGLIIRNVAKLCKSTPFQELLCDKSLSFRPDTQGLSRYCCEAEMGYETVRFQGEVHKFKIRYMNFY